MLNSKCLSFTAIIIFIHSFLDLLVSLINSTVQYKLAAIWFKSFN